MPTKERVIEIFKAAVGRDPQPKDILAIEGMAKPYVDENAIKETFEGLKAGEELTAKMIADENAKHIVQVPIYKSPNDEKPYTEIPVIVPEPKPVVQPPVVVPEVIKPKVEYTKTKAKKTTAEAIRKMAKENGPHRTRPMRKSKKTKK